MSVLATVVIDFGTAAPSASAIAELDALLNVDALGEAKSSFAPGDSVYLLVAPGPDLLVRDVRCTLGVSGVLLGTVAHEQRERLAFRNTIDQQALRCSPDSEPAPTWYGQTGRTLARTDTAMTVAGNVPCIADVTYQASFSSYRVDLPVFPLAEEEEFPAEIVVYLEEAA